MTISDKLMGYTPAVLKSNTSLGSFIEYYVYNPAYNSMTRYRVRLKRKQKHYASKSEFRSYANSIILAINTKLASGWTPFGEQHDAREFTPMAEALESFLNDKRRDLRQASVVSYVSICKILNDWLSSQRIDQTPTNMFNHQLAMRFMDYILARPNVNNNTYNSHLKKYRALGSWMVDHCFTKENPFDRIKVRPKIEKKRGLIPSDARELVLSYVRKSNEPNFEIVMHLIFYSLIRPSEIERIRVRDVDIKNFCIHLQGDQTKTHKERYAPLNSETIALLEPLIQGVPNDWFLIGHDFCPDKEPCYHGLFKKRWIKIRRRCKLPEDMQLYSLKDSGITELLQSGLDPLTVMKAADHHDLTTTTKYASHRDEGMIAKVRGAGVNL